MGNQKFCSKDTRIEGSYMNCGRQSQYFRNSTAIHMVGEIPVITGPPLNFNKQQTFKKVEKSAIQFCQVNNLDESFAHVVVRIIAYGHNSIFKAYQKLPIQKQQIFLEDVRFIQFDFLDSLYHNYIVNQKKIPNKVTMPYNIVPKNAIKQLEIKECYETGNEIIKNRKVGFLIMCAGSSSRFNFHDKFMIPLNFRNNKSLLEITLGRIRHNCGVRQGQIAKIPIIIACIKENRESIENFLREKEYCGFQPSQIRYMKIYQIPVLDKNGHVCLSFEYKILERPGGTAKCIEQLFFSSKYYNFLKSQQIQILQVVGCENLAENPGDPFILGYLLQNKLDMVGKCVDPEYPTEDFPRYLGLPNGKNILSGLQEILRSNLGQKDMQRVLINSPISMNCLVFKIERLRSLIKEYDNSIFLSRQYRTIEKCQNYFNFDKQKPEINQNINIFQKDLGHFFSCTKNAHLLKYSREHFIPIVSKNNEYSINQACQKFKIAKQNLSSSSYSQSRQSTTSV